MTGSWLRREVPPEVLAFGLLMILATAAAIALVRPLRGRGWLLAGGVQVAAGALVMVFLGKPKRTTR